MTSTSPPRSARLRHLLQRLPSFQIPRRTAQEEGKFTFFVKLPAELGDRVWYYAAQEERVTELNMPTRDSGILEQILPLGTLHTFFVQSPSDLT